MNNGTKKKRTKQKNVFLTQTTLSAKHVCVPVTLVLIDDSTADRSKRMTAKILHRGTFCVLTCSQMSQNLLSVSSFSRTGLLMQYALGHYPFSHSEVLSNQFCNIWLNLSRDYSYVHFRIHAYLYIYRQTLVTRFHWQPNNPTPPPCLANIVVWLDVPLGCNVFEMDTRYDLSTFCGFGLM